MGRVYKRPESGTAWWIDFSYRGKRYREPGGRTKALAEDRLRDREAEVRGGVLVPDHRRAAFVVRDLVALWLASPRAQRKKSAKDDQERLAVVAELLGPTTQVDALRRADIDGPGGLIDKLRSRQSRAGRELSPATINRHLAALRTALAYAAGQGHEHRDPMAGVDLLKEAHRTRTASDEELEDLLASADPELALAIVLGVETGARLGELADLRWNQIDTRARMIRLDAVDTKTGMPRSVPLSKAAARALATAERRSDGSVFASKSSALSVRFHKLTKQLGIEGLRFHDLRRTAATRLRRAGVDLLTIASITGHKSIEMLRRYQEILDEDKLAAVDRASRKRGER